MNDLATITKSNSANSYFDVINFHKPTKTLPDLQNITPKRKTQRQIIPLGPEYL